jgi:hypothetical protein
MALSAGIRVHLLLLKRRHLRWQGQQIEWYALFAHFPWRGSTSLPLALKTSSFALAGSIPTEFGKLINMKNLWLNNNKLSGTPSLLILPGVVVRVYHLL